MVLEIVEMCDEKTSYGYAADFEGYNLYLVRGYAITFTEFCPKKTSDGALRWRSKHVYSPVTDLPELRIAHAFRE